ncbi:hypothetical protein BHF71_07565 [Vulcanibacillus modesticaldus]|uniref:Solute-binding protein family 5 domain-containing protein n=1 Tax=Vulcanibacillus modesticaldus TaxID=337097 RepID=A0A1D2YVI0_9BACI|nr:oligopeptide ABC transporter substrate-binding protein [Vulcanibacillus modesticaldus]OEF99742.1 hypothetical protein BHF71_07565 [Vulcanibacillus modesticaldus]
MFKKSLYLSIVLILVLGIALVGCSSTTTDEPTQPDQTNEGTTNDEGNKEEATGPVEGGTVSFAMFSAPGGIFNPLLYEDAYEWNVIGFVFEALLEQLPDLSYGPSLAESWEFSEDKRSITFKLRKGVKWHDGEEFTADDVVYTYTVLAHPDYTGTRSYIVEPFVGFEEFNSGETDTFKGVEKIDDYTVVFHLKEAAPNALDNINFPIAPEHVYGKYEVKDLVNAPETKASPIGTGPFKLDKIVTNESYELVRFDDYWNGKPYLDKIIWKVINQDVAPGLLKSGQLDVMADLNPSDVDLVKNIEGVKIWETPDFGYQYMGFKFGKLEEDGSITPFDKVYNDKKLRQAMAYAINRQGIVDGLLKGHGTVMNAPIPPVSWAAASPDQLNTYPYDPEKAKQLLDEAGYKDIDGDGFREDPNGNKFEITLDYPTGNKVREKSAPIIQQNLKEVGINIKLNAPRDVGSHYDAVGNDEVELFLAGWGLTTDPDPSGIWKSTDTWNFPRWVNEESDRLIQEGLSLKAFDMDYRKDVYVKWQQLVNDELPYIFLYSQNSITAYSDRIQNVKPDAFGITRDIHKWWVKQ